jgi:hypothetical protein
MKRAVWIVVGVLALGCAIPIRVVLWRPREGVGEVATTLLGTGVSYQQAVDAETEMRRRCQGPYEVLEEGSRDTSTLVSSAYAAPAYGGGAVASGASQYQQEYFWRFRCLDEE